MTKKIVFLPYDFDTAIGINNEGSLVFGYSLEDTDQVSGEDVFNGQQSVLWCNLRDTYKDEIAEMYKQLRSDGKISYSKVEQMFETHQGKWPEAIFNEDAKYKYLDPLEQENDATYLPMLQGSKAEQRKWWLFNRFRYMDSKWNAGDALTDYIQLRGYAKGNITVTPYADIYPSIKYGSYLVQTRGVRNQAYTLVCPLDQMNDTEIYIYSASALASIGDISELKVGLADFSRAVKLQQIKIGDSDPNYANPNLGTLNLGNNTLLQKIDVRNCTGLGDTTIQGHQQTSVDLSGCTGLEEVYFDGTKVLSVDLPNGGVIKKLHLPGTITSLTIRNQTAITEFVCPVFSNITTLWLDNPAGSIDTQEIVEAMANGSRVRLFNFYWEMDTLDDVAEMFNKLDTMSGLDQNGNNVNTAQVYGTIHVSTATTVQIDAIRNRYPDVTITYDALLPALIYKSEDGTETIAIETVAVGGTGSRLLPAEKQQDVQYTYTPAGWSLTVGGEADPNAITNVQVDRTVYAVYTKTPRMYTVTFRRGEDDGNDVLKTESFAYGVMPEYGTSNPVSSRGAVYAFQGWDPELTTVTGPATYTAVFKAPVTLTYYDYDNTVLHEESVAYGRNGTWSTTPTRESTAQFTYLFNGWSRTPGGAVDSTAKQNLIADRSIYAVYTSSLRSYTISFVRDSADGGGTLQTGLMTYGSMPSYTGATPTTTKTGDYAFNGWTPAIAAVTGAQTYTAVFKDMSSPVIKYLKDTMEEYSNSTAEKIAAYAFYSHHALLSAETAATTIESQAFANCNNLKRLKLTNPTELITFDPNSLSNCSSIQEILIYSSVCAKHTYGDLSARFTIPSLGVIYVNDNLVNTYKAASNWSKYADNIYPISNYPQSDFSTIQDSWETIIQKINNGTADYSLGDTKSIDLGSLGKVIMTIIGINKDELSDGSGNTAKYTWYTKVSIANQYYMNPSISGSSQGTGSIGGWEYSTMRTTYLSENGDIWNSLPSVLQANIKSVKKYSTIHNINKQFEYNIETHDKLFILSIREAALSSPPSYSETTGPIYNEYFNSTAKRRVGAGNEIPYHVWSRTVYGSDKFAAFYVGTANVTSNYAHIKDNFCFGFCT